MRNAIALVIALAPTFVISMLLPRGLTKKKVDPISARRRKIEDKERPFIGASEPNVKEDEPLVTAKSDFHDVWSNAVFVSLSEHRFSREDVRVSRMRKPGCKPFSAVP